MVSPTTSARRTAPPPSTPTQPATPPHPPKSDPHGRGTAPRPSASGPAFAAVSFDMDGVVTDTASLHGPPATRRRARRGFVPGCRVHHVRLFGSTLEEEDQCRDRRRLLCDQEPAHR